MRCIHTGNSNLEVNGNHFEDEVVMKDKSGEPIGARGVVFNYKPGDDKAIFVKISNQIRDEMQAMTPNAGLYSVLANEVTVMGQLRAALFFHV